MGRQIIRMTDKKKNKRKDKNHEKNSEKNLAKELDYEKKKAKKLLKEETAQIQKLEKVEKKKNKKDSWMLTTEEIETVLEDDYNTTTILCERKLLEGGVAYLVTCNDRYTEEHLDALISFHMRVCVHIEHMIKKAFARMQSGEKTREETEAYVLLIQGKCFSVLVPVVDIIQDMSSKSEFVQICKFFGWMEKLESMDAFLKKPGDYTDAMEKLDKMLRKGIPDDKPVRKYEKKLTERENRK